MGRENLEVEQFDDRALGIHDAARAERVAYALIHPVLERDIDVELERFQPALADRRDDVVGVGDGLATVSWSRQAWRTHRWLPDRGGTTGSPCPGCARKCP